MASIETRRGPEAESAVEMRKQEVKNKLFTTIERLVLKGKQLAKVAGFSFLALGVAEGAFAQEARADEVSVRTTIESLAKKADVPAPIVGAEVTARLTSLSELEKGVNMPEDKLNPLLPDFKPLSTPGVGVTAQLLEGLKVRASYDVKSEGGYTLVTLDI